VTPGALTSRPTGDDGMGTVLAMALITIVLMAAAGVAALGTARVVRHRAAVSADGAALAAATAAVAGETRACALAARAAGIVGARVIACRLTGEIADVQVELRPPSWLPFVGAARVSARAGPAAIAPPIDTNGDKAARLDRPS
jgi:secretion/DNA translocation related TadE-like protein